ncbi:MAG: hypothetical protein JOZ28_11075, partial [Candidatus Eremiobacteraeota bacterium]|nr:hypothetical protein [Candidatus Eremiobacteraeota bacterium]
TAANPPVTAYAAKRPDGSWSVMIVNKDAESHDVDIDFGFEGPARKEYKAPLTRTTFGVAQYRWRGTSATEIPAPNDGPLQVSIAGNENDAFVVPAYSITIFRGLIESVVRIDP